MDKFTRSMLMNVGILKDARLDELDGSGVCRATPTRPAEPLDEKVGFNLGWDYAQLLGWFPEGELDRNFLGGFETGRRRGGILALPDRFTRKWLQLRYNAWKRNRAFDENVTPAFLQLIDRPYCPVMRTELTHATGEVSDWSVDRLNNQGGYAIGNLAVMSTKANAAKGARGLEDIEELCRMHGPAEGLTPLEWKRMLSLVTGAYSIARNVEILHPLCITPPPYVPLNFFQELQLVIAKECGKKPSELLDAVRKLLPSKALSRQFQKIVQKIKHCRQKSAPLMEVWLQPPLQEALQDFYLKLPPATVVELRQVVEAALGSERVSDDMQQRWALENKGFSKP